MEANTLLQLIEQYGLPLILLLGSIYALYRFLVFSLYEVKNEFGRRHEDNAKAMSEVKESLAEIKSDIKLLVEFIRSKQ
tara:strand:+ start:900 stop:1136 length:237 start_codon:yes stop_codon:yes gene_type:complete